MVLWAAHGAQEQVAHLAMPSVPATGIAPWSVQLTRSAEDKQLILFICA